MPCALGWPVWSVARHGGGMRACVSCKVNYAATVKEIMPSGLGSASRYTVSAPLFWHFSNIFSHVCLHLGLTERGVWTIIMFTHAAFYAQETEPPPQNPGASATGLLKSPSRAGLRRTVSDARVFRSPRPRSGHVRNAAPGRNRGTAGEPVGSRFRVLTPLFLPGARDFPTGRPAGADAPEAGAQASSQAHRRGARLPPPGPSGRSL